MEMPGRVLIVEPEEVVLLNTIELLQGAGYPCTPVQEGQEALFELESNEFDLMIAEIQMAGNEGLELVQAARRYAAGMPVILFTGYPSLNTALAAIQLQVAAYLIKPVASSLLLQQVQINVAKHRAAKRMEALVDRSFVFAWAIEETIYVLESTRSAFKSNKLAALRRKLKQILASVQAEQANFSLF